MDDLSTAHHGKTKTLSVGEPRYRPDIDGLRAIAIISVVVFHAFPDLAPGGFVGVDIFFVISGYLISKIILKQTANGAFSFLEFYGRRIRRIFPALIIVLLATLAAGNTLLLKPEIDQLTKHIVASTFFAQNFLLLSEAGYFDRASDMKPLLHLWSLSVEEQFYILFPILIVSLNAPRLRVGIPVFILAFAIASYRWGHQILKTSPEDAFYLPYLRAWELLAGAVLTATEGRIKRILSLHRGLPHILSLIGLGIILHVIYALNSTSPFPGRAAFWPVFGTVCIIAAGAGNIVNRRLLSSRPFVWTGLISYPLYLWHWPILSYLRIVVGNTPPSTTRLIAVAISIGLAYATYQAVERPLHKVVFKRYPSASSWTLALSLCCLAAAAAIVNAGLLDHYRPQSLINNTENFTFDGRFENGICRKTYPDIKSRFCNLAEERPPTVALIGDSHAMSFYDGLAPLVSAHNGNLLNIGGFSCMPVFDAPMHSHGYPFRTTECIGAINAVLAEVVGNPHISTVVLAGRRFVNTLSDDQRAAVEKAFRVTFDRLRSANKEIIYVLDFPELPLDPHACVRSLPWVTPDCLVDASQPLALRKAQVDFIAKLARNYPDVKILDPFEVLCRNGTCPVIIADKSLYIDDSHLSRDGSAFVAPLLADTIFHSGRNAATVTAQ
ncbi:acyltransferase [Rhizobium lentis]|uniref:acyltransferase family protein n=1 Tax=Rhizobium lentis TaxID=1138194 RepID=UPI001C83070D|nr:acyltransferase family protein [Rhizobium lentis]MBX5056656.1 acyltransferase [Rhizobium lentis]MBX5074650.1 acyltransferase [Rhizobium lentis]MBX5111662.1 acyltransferase [Rhizobium lentis]MBX5117982.1 acyltransferase [Rhizobium lentis]